MTKNNIFSPEWALRIGIFGTFLGHGIFALGGKESWIPLLTSVGFSNSMAGSLMPVIGALDMVVAIFALFYPVRIVLIWAVCWAFATALARPVSGLPIWDFVERTSNWAVPLALLLLHGFPKKLRDLLTVS